MREKTTISNNTINSSSISNSTNSSMEEEVQANLIWEGDDTKF